jgi:hypothetical protein
LEEGTQTTIIEMRRAYAVQRWLEKSARSGARYIEQILAHFGVKSSDSRLQRPEYLGGGKMPVQISEVLQTSASPKLGAVDIETPQGTMAGHGITAGKMVGFKKFFEEHGMIIGIMTILPRTQYMDGVHKLWKRFDKYDYFFPEFAHIGEQEVKSYELYLDNNSTNNDATFGYQERYAEYRTMFDTVHGDLRDTLDFWHLARKFEARPTLNNIFIKVEDITRIYPVEDPEYHKLICMTYAKVHAIRPIPKFGTPL